MNLFFFKKNIKIIAPVDGKIINVQEIDDKVFSQKLLGDGFGIIPMNNSFVAPISGKLITLFHTKHAYGIQHKYGIKVLLHIGIDTVLLNGEGFETKVKQNQNIKAGDLLCNVDINLIKNKIPSLNTPIIFIKDSMTKYSIKIIKFGLVKQGEIVAIVR